MMLKQQSQISMLLSAKKDRAPSRRYPKNHKTLPIGIKQNIQLVLPVSSHRTRFPLS